MTIDLDALEALEKKATPGPCVMVPVLAWEGFKSLVLAKCGKPVNRDKTPAELIEMARAMLAAAKEE